MMFSDKYTGSGRFASFLKKVVLQATLLLFLVFVAHFSASSQSGEEKDTTLILLADKDVQLECTQGLNDLYNFKFDQAEAEFKHLKSRYGWHPLPYFLMGLSDWWKIMPNTKKYSVRWVIPCLYGHDH